MKSLNEFADAAGVSIVECGPGWGGRYGYTTKDYPNCTECGYRTKKAAREGWAVQTFGEQAAKALFALLEQTP